jgi:glycosyltransferase involved in cell wall biosynthesis
MYNSGKTKKIMIITRDFPGIVGGVSDYSFFLSKYLADKEYDVYVLTSEDEKIINSLSGLNGKVYVKVLPIVKTWGVKAIPLIIKEVSKIKPDCICLQYEGYMYNRYGMPLHIAILTVLLRVSGFKIIITFHEVAIRFKIRRPKSLPVGVIQRLIAYILCIFSSRIIVSIEYFRKMLYPFRSKIVRIPIGSSVLPQNFTEKERLFLRQKISPEGGVIISFYGSGAPWRRADILLEAVKECIVKNKMTALRVLLIGKQGEDKNLLKIISDLKITQFTFTTGTLSNEEIGKYLSISDIYVMVDTDDYGGVSTKSSSLASAYAFKLPIIANKGLLTDEVFVHKRNIYLINNPGAHELAGALLEVIRNNELREELKKGAEYFYENFLKWSKIKERYTEIINELK